MNNIIDKVCNLMLSILYPPRCIVCDDILDGTRIERGICPTCEKELRYAVEPVCKKCGKLIIDSNGETCSDCRRTRHSYIQAKGVYVYEGKIKGTMYRFKYSNRRCYSYTFTRDIIDTQGAWIKRIGIEAIVPVPMYKKKRRKRGYNQAEVIARQLSLNLGIPYEPNLVIRNRNTTPMKGLSDTERQKNLKNAFNIYRKGLKYNKVLIIDDIYTTGATLDSVAKALREGGVREVYGLCLCVGRGYSS